MDRGATRPQRRTPPTDHERRARPDAPGATRRPGAFGCPAASLGGSLTLERPTARPSLIGSAEGRAGSLVTTTAARPTVRLDPWEQQPGETPPAFEAFTAYRDMGPRRSTAKVARSLGKSTALIQRWSRENAWVVRTTSYDQHLDREHLLRLRVARQKAARRGIRVGAKAMRLLESVIESAAQEPDLVKLSDVAAIARVALAAEENALKSVELARPVGPDGGADEGTVSGMSDEERRARLAMLVREAGTRLEETGEIHDGLHGADDPDDDEE